MKERPILFSAPMVRAINEDRKWKTRRVAPISTLDIKHHGDGMVTWGVSFTKAVKGSLVSHSGGKFSDQQARSIIASQFCPYGQPGDRLWVRETWALVDDVGRSVGLVDAKSILYRADSRDGSFPSVSGARIVPTRWRPSIHMPRIASRIDLEITGVCVERLNDISEADAVAEGITCESVIVDCNCHGGTHQEITAERYFYDGCYDDGFETGIDAYAALWEQINGPGSWAANPFVWVIEFKRITP